MAACEQSASFSAPSNLDLAKHRHSTSRLNNLCPEYKLSYTSIKFHLQSENENDSSKNEPTYYSPNTPLDENTFRYDLEDNAYDDESTETTTEGKKEGDQELAFFDEAIIFVRGGSGGQGSSTYKHRVRGGNAVRGSSGYTRDKSGSDGVPDGGNGGRGGDVVMVTDYSLNTLAGLTLGWRPNSFGGSGASYKQSDAQKDNSSARIKSFRAGMGRDGARQFDNGRNGESVEIRVPPGTIVQHEVEIKDDDGNVVATETVEIGVLTSEDNRLVVASGGAGGDGSGVTRRANAKGNSLRRAPPASGERKKLKLVLKLVADIALVGVPNAGKSTFLASVTRAKPKIANYPFTTVIPNLGVWVPPESDYASDVSKGMTSGAGSTGLVLCDVPGLVAGAAEGVGLGHAFLRHVERCHVILHLVDATSIDAAADFAMLNRELAQYGNGKLANMPQVVVVNKVDAFDEGQAKYSEQGLTIKISREELKEQLDEAMQHSRLMWVSAKEKDGVDELMTRMAKFVNNVKKSDAEAE